MIAFGVTGRPAIAEDDFVASLRLRGGYDSNPLFSNGSGAGGSAFIGTDAALAAARKADGYSLGVAAEASDTQYANSQVVPALSGKVVLRGMLGDDNASIASTTTIAEVNNYSVRSSDLAESIKGEVKIGGFKAFLTVEGARSSLNQTNAIFQDFLPNPQQYLRGTIIPGISYVTGELEIGSSVNLSVRRYVEELDVFGYRRDNERVQPFLFAKYVDKDLTISGAISRLYGTWHDVDFSNVKTFLYDANVKWTIAQVTVDLSASRRANETTFPISPITIDTIYAGKLSWQIDPKTTLSAAAGHFTTLYLDSPFEAQTSTFGVGAVRDIGNDLSLGVDLTCAKGRLISGERATSTVISTSLTKRFFPFVGNLSKQVSRDVLRKG
ncbi:MAG: outer membrane beta-barrel protein [Xanthobacteraceae bacterium]|nr:outer membrane beta-barrel protein [Xanthobacteraceae bacterium]